MKAAFQKTGVWPFNPGVISKEMIALSKETSCEGHLPIAPSTPVWILAKMLHKMAIDMVPEESDDREETEELEDGNVVGREDSKNEDNMEEERSDGNDSGNEDGENG